MAKDTSVMENTAEDLIAHKLQRAGILVAKPKFDQNGADLLALLDVKDNAKFCRIQCKGRTIQNLGRARVDVPKEYVSNGLVLFLYVETGNKETGYLFCFMGQEIRNNWRLRNDKYVLSLTIPKLTKELAPFVFDDRRIQDIRTLIMSIDVGPEFKTMGYLWADFTLPMMTLDAQIVSGN